MIENNGKAENVKVHPRLKDVLSSIQKEIAIAVKKQFGLKEVTIYGTVASEALAARYLDDKKIKFRIKKIGLNSGILEFI